MADINIVGLPENSVSDANDYLIINKSGVDYKQKAKDLLVYDNYPFNDT